MAFEMFRILGNSSAWKRNLYKLIHTGYPSLFLICAALFKAQSCSPTAFYISQAEYVKCFLHTDLTRCTCANRTPLWVPLTRRPAALDVNNSSARYRLRFYKRNRNFLVAEVLMSCSPSQEGLWATRDNK